MFKKFKKIFYHKLKDYIDDKNYWNCFKFVYPVTYNMSDGSTISMEDETDWAEIKAWHESNPDIKERPTLQYPIDITYLDGNNTQTIHNDEEMKSAREDCRD